MPLILTIFDNYQPHAIAFCGSTVIVNRFPLELSAERKISARLGSSGPSARLGSGFYLWASFRSENFLAEIGNEIGKFQSSCHARQQIST